VFDRDNDFRDIAVKLEPSGRVYNSERFPALIELTFQRIESVLKHGIQELISESEQREVFQLLGFVLDHPHLQGLGIHSPAD
jgi:hypothetical protein